MQVSLLVARSFPAASQPRVQGKKVKDLSFSGKKSVVFTRRGTFQVPTSLIIAQPGGASSTLPAIYPMPGIPTGGAAAQFRKRTLPQRARGSVPLQEPPNHQEPFLIVLGTEPKSSWAIHHPSQFGGRPGRSPLPRPPRQAHGWQLAPLTFLSCTSQPIRAALEGKFEA
jgi:hypothetical protein